MINQMSVIENDQNTEQECQSSERKDLILGPQFQETKVSEPKQTKPDKVSG